MRQTSKFAVLFMMMLLSVSACLAQTWTEKRTKLPTATTITGTYTPANAVPLSTLGGIQSSTVWDAQDGYVAIFAADANFSDEWENALFGYAEANDDGVSTTGPNTGWNLLWDSLNTGLNNNSGVSNAEITSMVCSSGVVTFTIVTASAQYLTVGEWVLYSGMPTGLHNGMFQVASAGGGAGTHANLSTTWTYNDSACVNGTYAATSSTFTANAESTPTMPMRRHANFTVYDTKRNAFWMGTGVADANSDATVVSGAHSGVADFYEMTKSTNWSWTQICGFGAAQVNTSAGAGAGVPAASGPGSLCGQEYLTTTTSNATVAGIPCLDITAPGSITTGGNNSSCGYKFSMGAYDATNDVVVMFGGQFNSGLQCEALMYYPATGHWKNPLGTTNCNGTTVPLARWAEAGSYLVDMRNGKMLLFGGLTGSATCTPITNCTFNDTWILTTCPETNQAACSWTKLSPTVSPAVDPDPVIDYSVSLGQVVYVDKEVPAHTWFFSPVSNQWTDVTGTGGGGNYNGGPTLTSLIATTTQPYFSIGSIDQTHNTFVIFNLCTTTSTPSCSPNVTQVWTLSLPTSTVAPVNIAMLTTQEALPYNGTAYATGVIRTNEPVSVGIPLVDGTGITATSGLGCSGSSACGFRTLASWPSGNIEWVEAYYLDSVNANSIDTSFTLTTGTGNVGTNIATDNGTTITVTTGTGANKCTYTVQKAKFDVLHSVVCNSKTIVPNSTTASQGVVLMGPAYTSSVTTCAFSSSCTTAYTSANDTSSNCVIEQNSPVIAVLKCSGGLKDASGNQYQGFLTRLTFYAGNGRVQATVSLKNDYDCTPAPCRNISYMGYESLGLSLTTNLTGANIWSIGDHGGTGGTNCTIAGLCTGTLSTGQSAYLYQGYSTYQFDTADYNSAMQFNTLQSASQAVDITRNFPTAASVVTSGGNLAPTQTITVEVAYTNGTTVTAMFPTASVSINTTNCNAGACSVTATSPPSGPPAGIYPSYNVYAQVGSGTFYLQNTAGPIAVGTNFTFGTAANPLQTSGTVAPSGTVPDFTYVQDGYEIVTPGGIGISASSATVPTKPMCWADVYDNTGGQGIEFGIPYCAAQAPRSLQIQNGGLQITAGISPDQVLWTATCTSGIAPCQKVYYQPWPYFKVADVFLIFHDADSDNYAETGLTREQNEFLRMQYPLIARASVSYYNTTEALPYPMPDPSAADTYFTNLVHTDIGLGHNITPLKDGTFYVTRFWDWSQGGGGNQNEWRYGDIVNRWLERGFTSDYLFTRWFDRFQEQFAWQRGDDVSCTVNSVSYRGWACHTPSTDLDPYVGEPSKCTLKNANSCGDTGALLPQNCTSGTGCTGGYVDPVADENSSGRHYHWWSAIYDYMMTGDEDLGDMIRNGAQGEFTAIGATKNYTTMTANGNRSVTPYFWESWQASGHNNQLAQSGSYGGQLSSLAEMYNFFIETGDTQDATFVQEEISNILDVIITHGVACVTTGTAQTGTNISWPSGCTPVYDGSATDQSDRGFSAYRGIFMGAADDNNIERAIPTAGNTITSNGLGVGYPTCLPSACQYSRDVEPFMQGYIVDAIWRLINYEGPLWSYYNTLSDAAYGAALGVEQSNYVSGLTTSGYPITTQLVYTMGLDQPNTLTWFPNDFNGPGPPGVGQLYAYLTNYLGVQPTLQTHWENNAVDLMAGATYNPNTGATLGYVYGTQTWDTMVYYLLNPSALTLQTICSGAWNQPGCSATYNGGTGQWTLSWFEPNNLAYYLLKENNTKTIVDSIAWNEATNEPVVGNSVVATEYPWAAASYTSTQPASSATTITVTAPSTASFMLKAYATAGSVFPVAPGSTTTLGAKIPASSVTH